MTLYGITEQFLELLTWAEDPEVDDQAFNDTMEALSCEIEEKADGYAKVIKQLQGEAETIKTEIDRLNSRKEAIENHIKAMKGNLEQSMIVTGKEKFKTELFSFNIQNNAPSVVLDVDEDKVPEQFIVITKKVDKTLLVRRLDIAAQDTRKDDGMYQLDLFTDYDALDKERRLQRALLEVRKKYGSNALLRGFNYMNGGTARERNLQIGGHKA